jgi:hypothetical protein
MIASTGQPRAEMTAILHPRADPNVTAAPKNAIKQFLALAPQNGLRVM